MTPKEKAKDLISKMNIIHYTKLVKASLPISMYDDQIKGCALIAVDEILENLDFELCDLNGDFFINPKIAYFKDVKKEIELL
jgi:hypothetical protein